MSNFCTNVRKSKRVTTQFRRYARYKISFTQMFKTGFIQMQKLLSEESESEILFFTFFSLKVLTFFTPFI